MGGLRFAAALNRELPAAQHIPYAAHVSQCVIKTVFGDYVQIIRLGGASFESADDEQLNGWHERLNVLWRNLATPQLALWTHVVRRRELISAPGVAHGFAGGLSEKYYRRLSRETLMVNELYVAIVYRQVQGKASGWLSKAATQAQRNGAAIEVADALDACEKLAQTLEAALAQYEPERLKIYTDEGRMYSSALEVLGLLINGEFQRVPLPRAPLNQVLATTRLLFGYEVIEYRQPTRTRVGAVLGIKEYPTPTVVGMLNRLLTAPFPFILTQSFSFLSKAAGQGLLQRQYNRMSNAGDLAISQAEELKDALDALASNEFVMGDHHLTLQVLADEERECVAGASGRLRRLNDQLAVARAFLADTGMIVAREDLALEAAFWAQLPGHFPMRPRKAPITSRNFAALAPFHNYPMGRAHGNHWGDALAVLMTSASSPYYFSLHASDPASPDGGSRKDTGHTLICGPTGSGKTVLIGFLVSLLTQRGATQVLFDKDHGLEILTRALGGTYLPLKNGRPTGFNPLQLPADPNNIEFMKAWLRTLIRRTPTESISVRDDKELEQALRGVLSLDAPARRLSRLIEFTDATSPEGVYARLSPWCEVTAGAYAWAFDNPTDSVVSTLAAQTLVGFDVTDFLDNERVRGPITVYLFHLVRQLLDGRRLVCWMDEFWRLLGDPAFETFAKDGPKTWRKLNGVMCLATQSVSDVLQSDISRTIVEQTPTKIFFPNADAVAQDYIEGLGLTQREFGLIKQELQPGSRRFVVRQGHQSVVCELDLSGFDEEIKVISGRASEVERMHRLMEARGSEPDQWLPMFQAGIA